MWTRPFSRPDPVFGAPGSLAVPLAVTLPPLFGLTAPIADVGFVLSTPKKLSRIASAETGLPLLMPLNVALTSKRLSDGMANWPAPGAVRNWNVVFQATLLPLAPPRVSVFEATVAPLTVFATPFVGKMSRTTFVAESQLPWHDQSPASARSKPPLTVRYQTSACRVIVTASGSNCVVAL